MMPFKCLPCGTPVVVWGQACERRAAEHANGADAPLNCGDARLIRTVRRPKLMRMVDTERLLLGGERSLRSTAPIYRLDHRDRLELFGTGVFVRHQSQHFVISAAHVLSELRERELRIGGESHVIPLTGPFFHSGAVGEVSFVDDAFDIAFVPLSELQVSELGQPTFVSTDDIDLGSTARAPFFTTGFIASDYTMVGPTQPVQVEATTLVAMPAPAEKYLERGVSENTHLLLSFDRLKTHSGEGQAATPKINGMSGCGVWRVGSTEDALTAILIEHHQQQGKFIVSTRVTTIIQGMSDYVAGRLQVKRGVQPGT